MSADSHGDDDTLAHTAGKLVRIGIHPFLGFGMPTSFKASTALFQASFADLSCSLIISTIWWPILEYRIKGSHRVLEDHAALIAAELFHLRLGDSGCPHRQR